MLNNIPVKLGKLFCKGEKMRTYQRISFLLCLIPLTVALFSSTRVQATTDQMKEYFDSEMTGINIQVNASTTTNPGENMSAILTLTATADVTFGRIGLEVFGFVNGTDQLLIGNLSDSNFRMNNSLRQYPIVVNVPANVWGITYGQIDLAYSVNMGQMTLTFPNIVNGFPLTLVENTQMKNLQEQIRTLNDSYANLTKSYSDLNSTYWNLNQSYASAQNSLGELDNTRRLTTILAITTVVFLATTIYIILRRPRENW
jgi:hypothetical protein